METTIKINTDAITPKLIEGIKKLFPHKMIEIYIRAADETEFIESNPAYCNTLQERIVEYESKKKVISMKANELI